jgi:hypothetical protein
MVSGLVWLADVPSGKMLDFRGYLYYSDFAA